MRDFAVSSCSARLLVVVFNGFRHLEMNHKPAVLFVDPHPESHSSHNHLNFVHQPGLVNFYPLLIAHPRMEMRRIYLHFLEFFRNILAFLLGQAINDPTILGVHFLNKKTNFLHC